MSLNTLSAATCGFCSGLYLDPRMLQCLHSFCSKCLKRILEEQGSGTSLKCPTCKKPTTIIPKGNVTALPKDLRKSYEAEVAQIASKMQSKEETDCDQCVDPSSGPAVSFCVNCCDFLCKACAKHHKTWRKTLNHDVQPISGSKLGSNLRAAKPLDNIPHKPMYCQLHEDETLKFFCETCCSLICRDCMAIEHTGHKYDRIEKVEEKEKERLVSLLKNADGAKVKLDSAITKGSKVAQQIQANQKVVEKDIKGAFKVLNRALADREQSLLAKAVEISLGKQTALAMQGEELKMLHKEVIETCEVVTAATEVYTPPEMLSAKGAMANKLEQLLKQYNKASLEPCRSDVIPSMLATSESVEHIRSFGMVAGGSFPDEAKTDLYIPRAIRGKEKTVVVTTCGMSGEPFPSGGERVEASLSLLGSQYPPVLAKVVDNKNGTYVTSFTPERIGEHELCITIEGKHIKGSPFLMYVRQQRDYRTLSSTSLKCFSVSAGPYDVAVDDNEVYVVVYGNNCIDVFNQNRQHTRTIRSIRTPIKMSGLQMHGGLPANVQSMVQFNSPSAIAVRGGVLYVVESRNSRVQKLTTSGTFLSSFGMLGSGNGQLNNPRGVCLDSSGRVFISDCGNSRISVFEADGTFLYHISGNTVDSSNLNAPWGLTFDQCGNLHVVDTNSNTIKVFTPQGQYITQYNSGVNQPACIAIDEEGNIFVTNHNSSNFGFAARARKTKSNQSHAHMSQTSQSNDMVCILDSKYNIIRSFGATNQNATGITIDKEGFIYICSMNYHQVNKI